MTLKILICDDVRRDAELMRGHVAAYLESHSISAETECACDEESVAASIEKAAGYDLIFLDIYMKDMNGVELARRLRERGVDVKIVFVSTSRDHALEAFGVNASQYLVKPVEYIDVERTLDLVLDGKLTRKSFPIQTEHGVVSLSLKDIVYSETQRHYQCILLADGTTVRARLSCSALFSELGGRPEFVRAGVSYIINLNYVLRINSSFAELVGGVSIHLPRGAAGGIKRRLLEYGSAKNT